MGRTIHRALIEAIPGSWFWVGAGLCLDRMELVHSVQAMRLVLLSSVPVSGNCRFVRPIRIMPSALTHMLVGAASVQVLPAELPRGRIAAALALAAAAPDLDVVAFALGIPYEHPLGHRGLSHSLVAALLVGVAVALVATWNRHLARRHLGILSLTGFLAVASHGVLDAATNAGRGIGFLVPFSNERYFFPWRPIETASVNPQHFFSAHGLAVLQSEITWVWLPLVAASCAWFVARQSRRRSASPVDGA